MSKLHAPATIVADLMAAMLTDPTISSAIFQLFPSGNAHLVLSALVAISGLIARRSRRSSLILIR
ncbi:MAG: hypothetical protein AB7P03_05985 [Kofleriaceae bacterium]